MATKKKAKKAQKGQKKQPAGKKSSPSVAKLWAQYPDIFGGNDSMLLVRIGGELYGVFFDDLQQFRRDGIAQAKLVHKALDELMKQKETPDITGAAFLSRKVKSDGCG
jgi:hypothetical protein